MYMSSVTHEKTCFLSMGKKGADLISAFVFAIEKAIPLLSKSKFQASSHLLWLYSLVFDVHGRKPKGFLTM